MAGGKKTQIVPDHAGILEFLINLTRSLSQNNLPKKVKVLKLKFFNVGVVILFV